MMGHEEIVKSIIETGGDITTENKELWLAKSLAKTPEIKTII